MKTRESDMSFAASVDDGAIEYSGAGLRGLCAQPANLLQAALLVDARRHPAILPGGA